MPIDDQLDEAYARLFDTGPEFDGFLSNHGPMAADALFRLGRPELVQDWVTSYRSRLETAPHARWPIDESGWRDPLGDASRLGDWLTFFQVALREEPWQDVLTRWWPRLLPGALAAATHSLIRTGHVVRALQERTSPERVGELGQALGYWAARWQPMPGTPAPSGGLDPGPALAALPVMDDLVTQDGGGGSRARAARLDEMSAWRPALAALVPPPDTDIPAALDVLTDAAITGYGRWAHGNALMLVHSATAPRAAALVLPALPQRLWRVTYNTAWAVSAAITAMYRPAADAGDDSPQTAAARDTDLADIVDRAARHGDEHVIKLTEVAVESHHRGNPDALAAGLRAITLLTPA